MSAEPASRTSNLPLAIGLVLAAYAGFTLIDSSAKWLGRAGIPSTEYIFIRYAVHLALISALLFPRRGVELVRTRSFRLEFVRALLLLGSTLCNFLAVQFLPLTVTGAIAFTMPLILCALSVPLLGEAVGWRRWTAILVGFLGVLVIVHPGTAAFQPAALASLGGATCSALFFITTRRLAGVDSASTQQVYGALISMLCVAPFAFGRWIWPTLPVDWFFLGLIGIAGLTGHWLFSVALRYAPATILAPFAYFQIIFAILSSWFIFSEPPDVWIFLGVPIVIGAGFYIWWRERKLDKDVVTEVSPQD